MSVCGEEQKLNNEREQARSQKSAMGNCFGGLGAKLPAAGDLGAKPPAAGGTEVMTRSPQRSKILHFLAKITSF